VNSLTDKLDAQIDPSLTGGTIEPARVIATLKNGAELSRQVDFPSGSPRKPFSTGDVRRKLEVCNKVSIKPLASHQIDTLINTVAHLEDLENIQDLAGMLA
jgi:2-methylcitrate dehydratase PrpD